MHLNHAVYTTVVLHDVVLHTGTAGITIRICTVHLWQDFPYGFTHRTHGNHYVLWIFSTVILEKAVCPAGSFLNLCHIFFYNSRNFFIKKIRSFSCLEIDVRILRRSTHNRVIW